MAEKRPPTDFVHIGQVLASLLKSFRRDGQMQLLQIWEVWPQVVEPAVAQNARPAAMKDDLLVVHVSSSPWVHKLRFMKQDIVAKLNAAVGDGVVRDISFKIGSLD